MNVVVIGNPKTSTEKIKLIASQLTEASISVRYPTIDMLEIGEDSALLETFGRIDWADFVIAIPREGLTFDHATTSEVAYAKHRRKPVFIYYD